MKFLIFPCILVLVGQLQCNVVPTASDSTPSGITLQQFITKLRYEPAEFYKHHMKLIFTIYSFGDRLYNLTEDISPHCWFTIKATKLMLEKLTIFEELNGFVVGAMESSAVEVNDTDSPLRHPMEFVCEKLQKLYVEEEEYGAAFELAKEKAAIMMTEGRPPYLNKIFDSLEMLRTFLVTRLYIPEVARSLANAAFRYQLRLEKAHSNRHHLLVKSIVAIAQQKPEFTDRMQQLYEKSLVEIIPEITRNDHLGASLLDVKNTFWFLPQLVRTFYFSIAEDPILKKELENMAAIIGKDADKSDLDFSTI